MFDSHPLSGGHGCQHGDQRVQFYGARVPKKVIALLCGLGLLAVMLSDLVMDSIGRRLVSAAKYVDVTTDALLADRSERVGDQSDGINSGVPDLTPFNKLNPHEGWCPDAICNNSPICQPCRRRFLVIIATGRSGSTSLMSMLNLLPGIRLSGENNNQLLALSRSVHNFRSQPATGTSSSPGDDPEKWSDHSPGEAWAHNFIPKGAFACPVQHMIETINPPPLVDQLRGAAGTNDTDTILGFKTIRFLDGWGEEQSIDGPLSFFLEHFPCSRVVINFRSNVKEQRASQQRSWDWKETSGELRHKNQMLQKLADAMGPQRARVMDMDEWRNDSGKFDDLARWLGFQDCTYPTVMRSNYVGYGYEADRRAGQIGLGPRCRFVGGDVLDI